MIKRRMLGLAALLLAAALVLAACGGGTGGGDNGGDGGSADDGPITIGFISHLTGDAAVYGESIRMGTEVALQEINDAGGINGRPLEVVFEDDKLDANQAVAAARRLIEQEGVPVIMGSASSSISLSIAPIVEEAGVVQISAVSTSPDLAAFENVFMVMPSDADQGAAWADIARQWGVEEAALMYINNDYGIGVKENFKDHFLAGGGVILAEQGFAVGATDVRSELLKVKQSGAEVVFLVSHVKEGVLVLSQARELDLDATWVTDVAMQTQEVLDLAGEAAEGLYAIQWGRKDHPTYQQFAAAFTEQHGREVSIWADFAYDTTKLVAEAIANAGTDPQAIAQWLLSVDGLEGATGPISFGEDGFRTAPGSYQLYQVRDGQWVMADDQ